MKKAISILGSTGSIGTQSLEVARSHEMQIYALAANRNVDALEQQAREFLPKKVCIFETEKYAELKQRLADLPVQVLCGMEGLCDIASDKNADILINSVVGMVGLLPTLTAISAGLDIALANKETGCRRFSGYGTGSKKRRSNLSGRQRTFCHFPMFTGQSAGTAAQNHSDGFRRTVLRKNSSGTGACHCSRCLKSPELEHGQ